jgi:chromosome segregation ATPase
LDLALDSTLSQEDAQQRHARLEHEVVDLTSNVSDVGKTIDEGRQKMVAINAPKKSFHEEIGEVLFHNQSLMTSASLNPPISKLPGSEAIASTTDAVSIGSESEPLMSVMNTRVDDQVKRTLSEDVKVFQMLLSLMDKFDATKFHTASNHDHVTALQNDLKRSRQELLTTKDLLRDALQNVSQFQEQIETLTEVQRSIQTENGRLAEENNRWRAQNQVDQILLQEEKDEVELQQGVLADYQSSLMEKKFKLQDEETKLRNKQHELDRRAEDIQKTSLEFLEMENSLKEQQKSLTAWAFRLHLREATVHEKELALRKKEEHLKPGHTVTDSDSQMKAGDMSFNRLHSGDQKPDIVGYTHTTSGPQQTVSEINKVRFCFPFLCK